MGLKGGKAETQEAIVNNEGKLQISEIPAQSYYPRILFLFMQKVPLIHQRLKNYFGLFE